MLFRSETREKELRACVEAAGAVEDGKSVMLVWKPLGDADAVSMAIPRSVLSLLLATGDFDGKLKEAGWMPSEDGSWTSLSGASEVGFVALRTMVLGKATI